MRPKVQATPMAKIDKVGVRGSWTETSLDERFRRQACSRHAAQAEESGSVKVPSE
jgi:hypothetical protein